MKKNLWIVFLTLASQNIFALPTLYPEKFDATIVNRTNSSYLADGDDSRRYYVLPPPASEARVRSLHTVTANVGFCEEISQLQKYNLDTLQLINSMKTKDAATKKILDEKNSELSRANRDLAHFVNANSMQELMALDLKVQQLEKRLDDLYARYKTCAKDCSVLKHDIEDTQKLRMEFTTRRFELSAGNILTAGEYEKRKSYAESVEKNVKELELSWKKIQMDLKDLYVDFNRMFDAHAKREGGRVAISYNSRLDENIQQLRRDNPFYHFEKIQTKNASIKASAYSKNTLATEGSVLSFDVGGNSANGVLNLEAYPESFTGTAVLNLLAVCPLLRPELFGLSSPQKVEDLVFPLTVGFEYPSSMKMDITAKYNMRRMYELIRSQGTSGGFFSSKSWSHQDEEEFFKDTFFVDWKIQDEKQLIPFDEKLKINSDLRRQILSRLAGFVVMGNQAARLALAPELPKTTGAMVISDSLNKVCPQVMLCRGASLGLNVLQVLFGGGNTQQDLIQVQDVSMEDRYSSEQVVMQPMITTYR